MAELPGGAGHRSSTAHKWAPTLYFVIGQAGWFACVMSAADGAAWIGVAFAVVLVTLHVVRVARPVEELKLLAGVVVAGGIWESALVHSGLLIYPSGTVISGPRALLDSRALGAVCGAIQYDLRVAQATDGRRRVAWRDRGAVVVSGRSRAWGGAFRQTLGRHDSARARLGRPAAAADRAVAAMERGARPCLKPRPRLDCR
jgi:hypothetical protein